MEDVTAKPATEAQWKYLRDLAGQAASDGQVRLAAFALVNDPVTTVAASAEIARLKALIASQPKTSPVRTAPTVPLAATSSGHATTNAPVGRYAVRLPGDQGDSLVEVTKPTSGRWAGWTFVKTAPLNGEFAPEPVIGEEAVLTLNAIEADPRGCAGAYGRITGKCSICGRRLSDPNSKSRGIGTECMSKFDDLPSASFGAQGRRAIGPQPPERY